ncbi:ABC transporter ATP-binding protein [Streptomyces diastaticus]|uniref:ABC transporter ATP-binding protein n=1 Tax=Streptomyces diastaticus TaxID=1956 RepID=UPI003646B47E
MSDHEGGHCMRTAISVTGLGRSYRVKSGFGRKKNGGKALVALAEVDLHVDVGEVRGLLGPNGAGKTTLMKILSTILLPTQGHVEVLGHDVVREAGLVRRHIGIVFGGERGLYGLLTARENLDYWAAAYGVAAGRRHRLVSELLERLGLADRADLQVDKMSRGMKQRLHLARGLVGDPELLFLDEPTVGMDPVAARQFRDVVKELRDGGMTILLSTHDMQEAETVCDKVTLIDRGRVVGTEAPEGIGQWLTGFERVDAQHVSETVRRRVLALPGVTGMADLPDGWVRFDTAEKGAVQAVLEALVAAGVTALRTSLPSLEDVYVAVIGSRGLKV